jgi:hypothetical protein
MSRLKTKEDFFSFQIKRSDLGPLFIDILGIKPAPTSPLFDTLQNYRKTNAEVSTAVKDAGDNKKIAQIAAVMANPKLLIQNRMGGGSLPVDITLAVHAPAVDPNRFAMVQITQKDLYTFHLFATPYHYLAWWLERNASKAEHTTPNYIPPPIQFETVPCLLHCIDIFRRKMYQTMLDSQQPEPVYISTKDFLSSFSSAMKSRDMRWLAPAFIGLTPNLSPSATINTDILETMVNLDFITILPDENDLSAHFTLGEAGLAMGVEFQQSWFYSAGFAISLATEAGDWQILQQGFLAPTGLANHLFLINLSDENSLITNHQAMTRKQLDEKMILLRLHPRR